MCVYIYIYIKVLLSLNKGNNHWMLGDVDLVARHMTLYDSRKHGQTSQTYQVDYFAKLMPIIPYLLHATGFFKVQTDIPCSLEPFTISLAKDCPQQKKE